MTDSRQGFGDGIVKFCLWVIALLYQGVVAAVKTFYDWGILPSDKSPRPVISVGNITVGGSGKTPLVVAVVQALLLRQLKVVVLTRGYMPDARSAFSDEARMLTEHLNGVPVMVGANRRNSIEEALKHHAVDVFVCDDAFQHWPLKRDLDIVAVDARNPFGNGCLLPRGILRESPRALGRAQIIVLTKTDLAKSDASILKNQIVLFNSQALIVESKHRVIGCVEVFDKRFFDHKHFKGVSVIAFCGIADARSFRQSLSTAGFNIVDLIEFSDHYHYSQEDIARVTRTAQDQNIQMIMTTHKDAVKMQPFQNSFNGYRLYYLQVELELSHGKNVFIERIVSALHR